MPGVPPLSEGKKRCLTNNNPQNRSLGREVGCSQTKCVLEPPPPQERSAGHRPAGRIVLFCSPHAPALGTNSQTPHGKGGLTSKNNFPFAGQEIVPENEDDYNSQLPLNVSHVSSFEPDNEPSRKNSHVTDEETEALEH